MRILEHCFRVYAETAALEPLIRFYEELQGVGCQRRVKIPETATEAAKVGNVLILAGEKRSIDAVKYVDAIFYVDSLGDFERWLGKQRGNHPLSACCHWRPQFDGTASGWVGSRVFRSGHQILIRMKRHSKGNRLSSGAPPFAGTFIPLATVNNGHRAADHAVPLRICSSRRTRTIKLFS
jgi:hypothetical protein